MADALKRLFGPANLASGLSTVYTGVAAHTATIKTMTIVNTTAAAISVALFIKSTSASTAAADEILPSAVIEAGGFAMCDSPQMISGVEYLLAVASATGLTITGHGLDSS